MNDPLVPFLRARLDEDAAAALAAIHADGRTWQVSGSHADDGGTYWSIAAPTGGPTDVVELVGSGLSGGGAHTAEVAEHIARHDPERVLADVGSKRQALDHYERIQQHTRKSDGGDDYVFAEGAVRKQIQYMALAYAGHPDYQPEWAPDRP